MHFVLRRRGGGFCAKYASKVIGLLENDEEEYENLLDEGKLLNRYIRNTNITGVYEQVGGTCYAYAACSAYLNTIARIYGARKPFPTFKECYDIALYNGNNGGKSEESIHRLEKRFRYGVQCEQCDKLLIRDALTISVIISFKTSLKGWECVANGSFLEFPGGRATGFHAAVVEGYDFEKDCAILKNSWGGETASPRFDFTGSAAHETKIIRVFYTKESIKGKTNVQYKPNLSRCTGVFKGQEIDCAWMDYTTAVYESNYVCEFRPGGKDDLEFFGYNIFQWINLKLNRPKNQKYPKYFYINNDIRKRMKKYGDDDSDDDETCVIC